MTKKNNQIMKLTTADVLGRTFTVYGSAENPLFLARDVAEAIDYAKIAKGRYNASMMVSMVDADEKLLSTIFRSGQNREVWLLTEDGLYEVLMQSRKPAAKHFKKAIKKLLRDRRICRLGALDEPTDPIESAKRLVEVETSRRAIAVEDADDSLRIAFGDE